MTDEITDGELWGIRRQISQQKRASNRQSSADWLRAEGFSFEEKNGGAHLIVEGRFDFWPGTGLWKDRQAKEYKRGARRLIAALRTTLGKSDVK